MLDYGAEGYGLYWYCIELIAQNINEDNITFELEHDARIISRNLGLSNEKTASIMKYMVEVGLFEISNSNRIVCSALASRIDKSMTSNPRMRNIINNMRVASEDYSGYIYFIRASKENDCKIKIGRSKNPTSRLEELKRRKDCIGFKLEILHKFKTNDAVSDETNLHRKFKHINIENEWFYEDEELISHIELLRNDKIILRPDYDLITTCKIRREEKRREEIRKEEEREEREEREEIPHTPFSFQEEIKTESKSVINQDLKSMISKQAKSENKVTDIINFYRDNISSRNEDIQEQASYNQILIKNYDMDKMLIGLENYKRYLEVSKKAPMKLFFFIRDAIYNDYQVENVVATGKNIAVVPKDLVGKRFIIEGESIEFENDGYNKVGKDWKVTNAKNVDEMVKLVRGEK